MPIVLGAIADDFTGATDLANTLVRQGMRCLQANGVPRPGFKLPDVDAVVVALKSRTTPRDKAVRDSLAALTWLRGHGARQYFFKYCSTFDSTDKGNIGPVADALLDALKADFTVVCPAFPATGRTIYKGHLFVGDCLLSQSGMRDHPLTPMHDANLVNVLARQTPHKVALVQYADVEKGPERIAECFARLVNEGYRYGVVDAISDAHLLTIGTACAGLRLVTGGSGVALGLPDNFRRSGLLGAPAEPQMPAGDGRCVVLAGSCSQATLAQVARARKDWPAYPIDPLGVTDIDTAVGDAVSWAAQQDEQAPLVYYSSAEPDNVRAVQEQLGREQAGSLIERIHSGIARKLVEQGVGRLIVAGGETSGAVVAALGVEALEIGPEIDPGVPWTQTLGEHRIALALKSGNFGSENFFAKAFGMLP